MSENIHILIAMLPVILWFAPIVFASCYGMSAIQSGSWQRRPYSNKEMVFSQPKAVPITSATLIIWIAFLLPCAGAGQPFNTFYTWQYVTMHPAMQYFGLDLPYCQPVFIG